MTIEVFIDGASRGVGSGVKASHGEAACAVVIYKKQRKIAEFARPLGMRTNNEAEYEALISALLICSMSTEIDDPIIYSDSAVVVNQVNGKWKCTTKGLIPLLMSVNIIKNEYRFRLIQVPRDYVRAPDSLVNACLDQLADFRSSIENSSTKKANS